MPIVELAGELFMVRGLVVLYGPGGEPCRPATLEAFCGSLSDINRTAHHFHFLTRACAPQVRSDVLALDRPQAKLDFYVAREYASRRNAPRGDRIYAIDLAALCYPRSTVSRGLSAFY